MVRTLAVGLLLAVVASSAHAQIAIDPPDPTPKDDVTLTVQQFDSCPPSPDVTRNGFEIVVNIRWGLCLSPPFLITHTISLGKLPAGTYHVVANYGNNDLKTFAFTVFDANGSVIVSPSLGPTTGGTVVNVTHSGGFCLGRQPTSCSAPVITFGGVPATDVTIVDYAHFRATTPPHAPGAVEVRVSGDSLDVSSYAFRYFDRAADASPKFFEKILVPVIYNGAGANGSQWVTDVAMRNDRDYAIEPWRAISGTSPIPAGTPVRFGSSNAPTGMLVVVPREEAESLHFHAMVRDTSRSDSDAGTELPVARERDFSSNLELVDIPVDGRFRLMLRVYSLARADLAEVTIYSMENGIGLRKFYVPMTQPAGDRPGFGSAPDFIAGTSGDRIGLRIRSLTGAPAWAFATVTNNETQHVTIVSPQ